MDKKSVIKLAKPWQAKQAIPDLVKARADIALHTEEYERKHGPVETSPIEVRDFDAIKARSGISPSLKNRSKK